MYIDDKLDLPCPGVEIWPLLYHLRSPNGALRVYAWSLSDWYSTKSWFSVITSWKKIFLSFWIEERLSFSILVIVMSCSYEAS